MGAATTLNQAISDRIAEAWAAAVEDANLAACPLEMPGMPATGAGSIVKTGAAWGRVTFLSELSPEWESAGPGSAERYYERVQLEIFTKLGGGRYLAAQLADCWRTLWQRDVSGAPVIDGFTFQPTQVFPIQRTQGDLSAWNKTDCLTAFEWNYQPS